MLSITVRRRAGVVLSLCSAMWKREPSRRPPMRRRDAQVLLYSHTSDDVAIRVRRYLTIEKSGDVYNVSYITDGKLRRKQTTQGAQRNE